MKQLTEETMVLDYDGLFNLTTPINYSDATVHGAEIGLGCDIAILGKWREYL